MAFKKTTYLTALFFLLIFFNRISYAECNSWGWVCDIGYGIKMAESQWTNGLLVSGYAYHLSTSIHWPNGYVDGTNELALGAGYSRSYYNPEYKSEYSLFILGFADSFYKPEIHAGYTYQKYFDINDPGTWKWGIGYTPFIFVKPSLTGDAPLPLPGCGITTSLRYKNALLMVTYANQIFVNARIDLN